MMKFFNFFKAKSTSKQFVSEESFNSNCDNQVKMSPNVISQLGDLGISSDQKLRLEFFFYTNTISKASALASEIENLNYKVEYKVSVDDKTLFIVTGWTSKIKIADEDIKQWVGQMCELGYKYGCEFDGWGTDPTQDNT